MVSQMHLGQNDKAFSMTLATIGPKKISESCPKFDSIRDKNFTKIEANFFASKEIDVLHLEQNIR